MYATTPEGVREEGLARALEYAHTDERGSGRLRELIHRDLCPSNILIGVSGVA